MRVGRRNGVSDPQGVEVSVKVTLYSQSDVATRYRIVLGVEAGIYL